MMVSDIQVSICSCNSIVRFGIWNSLTLTLVYQYDKYFSLIVSFTPKEIQDPNFCPSSTLNGGINGYDSDNIMGSKKTIRHYSVNACLAPVASLHGMAITTIEGIGSTRYAVKYTFLESFCLKYNMGNDAV